VADVTTSVATNVTTSVATNVVTPSRDRMRLFAGVAGAMAFAIVIGCAARAQTHASPSALVMADVVSHESVSLRVATLAHEEIPAKRRKAEVDDGSKIPTLDGAPLDDKYPTLKDWVHPISGAEEKMPADSKRHFGALRHGIDRPECGRGHCGVDLHGPRGRPIIAVSAGTVVRVERRRDGGDGMSGRFVKIRHEDGTYTTYMHLDSIVGGLDVGDRVQQAQYIGKLGSTGVAPDAPHLHFGLEIPNRGKQRSDAFNAHYINPAVFLNRSRISPIPELKRPARKHEIKPAS
jgi:murein DD-endopeptidase MepM/ murein hydrolase activator NlpD